MPPESIRWYKATSSTTELADTSRVCAIWRLFLSFAGSLETSPCSSSSKRKLIKALIAFMRLQARLNRRNIHFLSYGLKVSMHYNFLSKPEFWWKRTALINLQEPGARLFFALENPVEPFCEGSQNITAPSLFLSRGYYLKTCWIIEWIERKKKGYSWAKTYRGTNRWVTEKWRRARASVSTIHRCHTHTYVL